MWYAIIGSLAASVLIGLIYISFRTANNSSIRRITGNRRWLSRIVCIVLFAALIVLLAYLMNVMNALVCFVHLVLFRLIVDTVGAIVSRIRGKKLREEILTVATLAVCVLYLSAGWYLAHHVRTTEYSIESDKIEGDIKIVQITDSHIGATFHADRFGEYVSDINALSPDVVVLTGDFVDDDTSRDDMIGACRALGQLETKYGVFFVYGNHDRGYYSEAAKGWKNSELRKCLADNGVTVLEDESYLVDGRFYIVGRRDRSFGNRASAKDLMKGLDTDKFVLMLDHQPYDFEAEAAAGADLVLCGHTHGGQFIPITHVGEWIGENDLRYGMEKRGNTCFIVSSGISDWTFKFKTGCHSEYCVIDISGK